jgi:hypothetical protein
MTLKIIPKTFGLAREELQLEEIKSKVADSAKGETILFPEFGAYTVEGSKMAFEELSRLSVNSGITLVTTLNLPSEDLPHAVPGRNYNTVFVFSRTGKVFSPQAKITPQSFEMKHQDEASPFINVHPYSHLNIMELSQDGMRYTAIFLVCSDLYVLQMFSYQRLTSDALICPANFGAGAEEAAENVIHYAVETGLFRQGYLCNSYQQERRGRTPLTKKVEREFHQNGRHRSFCENEMKEILDRSSVVYYDEDYPNFNSVLPLTQRGTFVVPSSRSIMENLTVTLEAYERIIEI